MCYVYRWRHAFGDPGHHLVDLDLLVQFLVGFGHKDSRGVTCNRVNGCIDNYGRSELPENAGYYKKFTVIDNRTGEEVDERTFTLKIDSDPFAPAALIAYRDAAETEGGYEQIVEAIDEILEEI